MTLMCRDCGQPATAGEIPGRVDGGSASGVLP